MKTPPDETLITRWIDGDLNHEELAAMDTYATENPELLAERDAVLNIRTALQQSHPANIDPPYPEFFNSRILRDIEDTQPYPAESQKTTNTTQRRSLWSWLAAPLALGAMTACFFLGTLMTNSPSTKPLNTVAAASTVYTPDRAVTADISDSDDATIIIIDGLEDIPDDIEMAGAPWDSVPGENNRGQLIDNQPTD